VVHRRLFQHGRWLRRRSLGGSVRIYRLALLQGGAPPVKTIALTRMAINLTVVVLYALNIWLRASVRSSISTGMSTPVVLSIVGVMLLVVSGWLGGQIVQVYGVSVEGRK
jgi:uncharacterized membrane protein